jgi:hypothetical protein
MDEVVADLIDEPLEGGKIHVRLVTTQTPLRSGAERTFEVAGAGGLDLGVCRVSEGARRFEEGTQGQQAEIHHLPVCELTRCEDHPVAGEDKLTPQKHLERHW